MQGNKPLVDIYAAPRGQTIRVGPRNARDAELENYLAALLRSHRAIEDAGRGKSDMPAAQALPGDLGVWKDTIGFGLGPFLYGQDLDKVSVQDVVHAGDRERAALCRQGYGTLLAALATDVPVRLSTPVTRIDWYRDRVELATAKGRLIAHAAIVTASTNVIAADKIEFEPDLPKATLDAANSLALGSYDHVGLLIPGNPFGLQRDDLVFEQSSGPRTAALLGRVGGTNLHVVEIAGSFGRELSEEGEAAMLDFAIQWLGSIFGTNVKNTIARNHATRWNARPYVLGAMSAATPGHAEARTALAEPVGRVWLAGEALHETQWGTVNGAWESGTRTAEAVIRYLQHGRREEPKTRSKRRKRRGEN